MKISHSLKQTLCLSSCAFVLAGCNLLSSTTTDTKSPATSETSGEIVATNADSTEEFTGKVTDLLKQGKSLTCDFTYADETGNTTEGMVFIANDNDRLRGDFSMTSAGETITSSLIRKEGYSYLWGSEFPQGIKTFIGDNDDVIVEDDEIDDTNLNEFDFDQEFEYRCRSWRVDASKFEEPSDIEFVDFSAQLENMMNATEQVDGVSCSVCDSLEGEAQTACLQALGC